MSCKPPIRTFKSAERVVVYSDGGTAPGSSLMFAMTPDKIMEVAPLIQSVRMTLIIENAQPDFKAQCAYQLTNNGVDWDDAQTVGTAQAVTGGAKQHFYTTDWLDISNTKRGIRFGVIAMQDSGSVPVFGRVTLVIDLKLAS